MLTSDESGTTVGCDTEVRICANPIFIVGCPRSGTTILAKSLGEHRELWVSQESDFIYRLFGGGRAVGVFEKSTQGSIRSWLRAEHVSQEEFLSALGAGVNVLFANRSRGSRWIDQTPLYTLMLDDLSQMFPGAVFLHVLRDGRRVVNSMINFLNRRSPEQIATLENLHGSSWWGNDFREACRTWVNYVVRAYEFAAQNPTRVLTVVNERLVADADTAFGEILSFLAVRHDDAPSKYFRTHRLNSSFFPDGAASPGLSEPWRNWTTEQRAIFANEAGVTLVDTGFAGNEEILGWSDRGQAQAPRRDDYLRIVAGVRKTLNQTTPSDATVLIVSRGDESLLDLDGRNGWHFPQDPAGLPAGHHPADSAQAIGQLEELRARGAEFFVVPATERWWLDHYEGFRRHLENRYQSLAVDEKFGVVFALSDSECGKAKARE
jgi:hypothetical protein